MERDGRWYMRGDDCLFVGVLNPLEIRVSEGTNYWLGFSFFENSLETKLRNGVRISVETVLISIFKILTAKYYDLDLDMKGSTIGKI